MNIEKITAIAHASMPLSAEHARIRLWAEIIQVLSGRHPEILELPDITMAFNKIGSGQDPEEVLGIKKRRGQSDAKEAAHYRANRVLAWVAGAMNTDNEHDMGLGLSLTDACEKAEKYFGIDADTLKRYWALRAPDILTQYGEFTWDSLRPSRSKPPD